MARVARFVDHLQRVFRHGKRDGLVAELRHGDQAVERAFQLADVGIHVRGDQLQHVVADVDLLGFGFFGEDGQARFVIGLLDIRDQAPLKARAQPLFQRGDVLGGRSLEMMICLPLSRRWSNARRFSCVDSFPAMNWISSMSSTSTERSLPRSCSLVFCRMAAISSLVKVSLVI